MGIRPPIKILISWSGNAELMKTRMRLPAPVMETVNLGLRNIKRMTDARKMQIPSAMSSQLIWCINLIDNVLPVSKSDEIWDNKERGKQKKSWKTQTLKFYGSCHQEPLAIELRNLAVADEIPRWSSFRGLECAETPLHWSTCDGYVGRGFVGRRAVVDVFAIYCFL
jgi:hypothetical protein